MTAPSPEALTAAGRALAEAELGIRRGTVQEAAARSYGVISGQVSQADMEEQIAARRAADHDAPAEVRRSS